MKNKLLQIICIFSLNISYAQQFSFQMTFIDAIGNSDSLILGYDNTATDTLDFAFGESNIISSPYNSGLDIRAGNNWFQQNFFSGYGQTTFETKKQILPNVCGTGATNFWAVHPIAEINIKSSHFPVIAYWNKTLFSDSCRNGSVFTDIHPGGWWDTGGFFRAEMSVVDSVIFNHSQFNYVNGADTINVYWMAFSDSSLLLTNIQEPFHSTNSINIFPNPATNQISCSSVSGLREIILVEIYNVFGQECLSTNRISNIDITNLPNGINFIKATAQNGLILNSKFLKK